MTLSFGKKLFSFLTVTGVVFGGTSVNPKLRMAEDNGVENQYIVVMKPSTTRAATFSTSTAQQIVQGIPNAQLGNVYVNAIQGFSVTMSAEDAELLSENPDVDYVEQDAKVETFVTWGIDRIDQVDLPVDNVYEPFNDGSGVDAYIIDTGIYVGHEDFGNRAEWGYNSVDSDDRDCNGHGTHVAGTVGGSEYGVAKNVNLVAVKVLNCAGSGFTSGIVAGVDWVRDEVRRRGRPATANLSLGGRKSQSMNDAVKNLHESGVVTVVAAGNSNQDAADYSPASEPTVLTVGATTDADYRAGFSNYGQVLDIFAPGQSITAPWIGGATETRTISGTSMASPHVCGAAALYLSASIPPADVTELLVNGATPDKVRNPGSGSPNKLLYLVDPSPNSPTRAPTRAPTPTGTRAPSPNSSPLSWNITMVEARDRTNEAGETVIEVLYESSDRNYDVRVFEEDCETSTDVFFLNDVKRDSNKQGFIFVDVDLTFDQTKLEDSPLWDDRSKSFSFCLSKSLYVNSDLTDENRVTRRDTMFRVSVDNQASFDISGILVEEDEIDEEELSVVYSGKVNAFQCDENSYERVEGGQVLGPFDTLNVCVEEYAEADVVVSGIADLTITQEGTGISFLALQNGSTKEEFEDLVSTKCNSNGVCMARVQLINAFFQDTRSLNVEGAVTLGGKSRKLNVPVRNSSSLRAGRNGNKKERNLEENDEFALTVNLAEPCKEGKGAKNMLQKMIRGQD